MSRTFSRRPKRIATPYAAAAARPTAPNPSIEPAAEDALAAASADPAVEIASLVSAAVNVRYYRVLIEVTRRKAEDLGCGRYRRRLPPHRLTVFPKQMQLERALIFGREAMMAGYTCSSESSADVTRWLTDSAGTYLLRWILEALAEQGLFLQRPGWGVIFSVPPERRQDPPIALPHPRGFL